MSEELTQRLRDHDIRPSAQRVAVAEYVLGITDHPSADQVWQRVREYFPVISRATVYNTLNLFVEKGLLRRFTLADGHAVFDPNTDNHHHFIDEASGEVQDVPWEALNVRGIEKLKDLDVEEFQVVLRGRRKQSGPLRIRRGRIPQRQPTPAENRRPRERKGKKS